MHLNAYSVLVLCDNLAEVGLPLGECFLVRRRASSNSGLTLTRARPATPRQKTPLDEEAFIVAG